MPELVPITISRLISLVAWIGEHPGVSLGEAAAHFGRTRKQMKRDIEAIGSVGDSLPGQSFEIDWDAYATEDKLLVHSNMGISLPPRLTAREATAILVGLEALAPNLDPDLRARIPRTACQVRALVSSTAEEATQDPLSQEEPQVGEAFPLLTPQPDTDLSTRLETVAEAISTRRPLSFTYTRADGLRSHRRVDPWELRFESGGWMLHAWCHDAQAERVFALSRIDDLLTEEGRSQLRTHTTVEAPSRIELELGPGGRWVGEEFGEGEPVDTPHGCRVTIPVWNPSWIESLLIDVSPVLISAPDKLKRQAGLRARRIREVWDEYARKEAQ